MTKSGVAALTGALALAAAPVSFAQTGGLDEAATQMLATGYLPTEGMQRLASELQFQSAVQSYLWALPALNMYGMKEGSVRLFGKGYNVLPVWKERLNAKT